MTDRHKNHPRAVRMPDGLEEWFTEFAGKTRQAVNAVLVAALEEFRQRHQGGSTTAAGGATTGATTRRPRAQARRPAGTTPAAAELTVPAAPRPAPAGRPRCPHPGTRVIGGWCKQCQAVIEPGGYLPDPKDPS